MNEETKSNKEDEPTSSDAHPQDIPTAKKGNWVGKISKVLIRALLYSVFFIFLIVAAAGIVLEYYFPAEEARLFAEGQISRQLKLPLKIQKIDFSLFSGLQMDNVVLGFPAMPVAKVKKVVLDYDLTQLLQGKLVISQILIDHPKLTAISKNGVWNFKPLLELKKPSPSPSDNDKPQVPFPIPEIDIKKLTVRSASASLDQGKNLKAHITGLSLEAQGKVSLSTIDLKLKVLIVPDPDAPSNIGFSIQRENELSIPRFF